MCLLNIRWPVEKRCFERIELTVLMPYMPVSSDLSAKLCGVAKVILDLSDEVAEWC